MKGIEKDDALDGVARTRERAAVSAASLRLKSPENQLIKCKPRHLSLSHQSVKLLFHVQLKTRKQNSVFRYGSKFNSTSRS